MQRNASDVFALLIDETKAEQPQTSFEAEYQEIVREQTEIETNLQGTEVQRGLLTQSRGLVGISGCESVGGVPNFPDLLNCLRQELQWDTGFPWPDGANPFPAGEGPYSDEDRFNKMNTRVRDLLSFVDALQTAIRRVNLLSSVSTLDIDLTQFEKNVDTFQSNVRATQSAIRLYRSLKTHRDVRSMMHREQLKVYFKALLKGPGDQNAVIDEAELNQLVDRYLRFLESGGFAVADSGVDQLADAVVIRGNINRENIRILRTRLTALERFLQQELPTLIADVNSAQSLMVERVNFIYDHSSFHSP